ncbi:MAG: DUF3352 domain-containing protein [Solirubrobacterales bacterium]
MRRPSPGRILGRARERIRGARGPGGPTPPARNGPLTRVRDAISGAAIGLGGLGARLLAIPRAIGRGADAFWTSLPLVARRRLVAALGAALALALFLALAVPNLPCQLPGGDSCPPPDDAEELVPADALLYAHVNLDPDTEQAEDAADVAAAIPIFTQQVAIRALRVVPGPEGAPPGFERDIEPWFGGEAALAIVPGAGRQTAQVALLEVADADRARQYANEIAAGRTLPSDHRGIELTVDQGGLATAQVGGFLAIGPPAALRAVIDTETGAEAAESLVDDSAAEAAREELPDHRLAEAYVSEEGIAELIEPAEGLLGTLTTFLAPGATRGAAVALSAGEGELELSARSVLDEERARARPGFFAAFPPFEPELPERLEQGTLAYVGIAEPARTIRALLAQASAQAPGIAAGFEDLVESLRRRGEIDVERELLPALGGEAAFALEPGRGGGAGATPTQQPLPYLGFLADGVDEERARRALAVLQAPIAESIDPQLQAPVFGERDIDGVEARTLRVSPVIELSYAVFEGLAAVATHPLGIERLVSGDGGLDEAGRFREATDDLGEDETSLLGFFDLGQVVALGERLGLAEDPVYATFAAEFRRLDALGLAVESASDLLSTDARLLVEH